MTDCKGKNVVSVDESLLEKKDKEIKHLRKQISALQNEAIRSFTEAIHYNERILYNVVAYHDRVASSREDGGGCMTIRNQLIASQAILADARDAMLSYTSIGFEDQEQYYGGDEDDKESVKSISTSTTTANKEARREGGLTSDTFKDTLKDSLKNPFITESLRTTPNQSFIETLKELTTKLAMHHSNNNANNTNNVNNTNNSNNTNNAATTTVATPQQTPESLVSGLGQNLQEGNYIPNYYYNIMTILYRTCIHQNIFIIVLIVLITVIITTKSDSNSRSDETRTQDYDPGSLRWCIQS